MIINNILYCEHTEIASKYLHIHTTHFCMILFFIYNLSFALSMFFELKKKKL